MKKTKTTKKKSLEEKTTTSTARIKKAKVKKKVVKKPAKKRKATKKRKNKPGQGRKKIPNKVIVEKLTPYLKMGMSITKACILGKVHRETVTKRMKKDVNFRTKIEQAQSFQSVLMANVMLSKLVDISNAVDKAKKTGMSLRSVITKNDLRFLQMEIRYNKAVRDEWGDKLSELEEEAAKVVQFDTPKSEVEADLQIRVLNRHHDYIKRGKAVRESD